MHGVYTGYKPSRPTTSIAVREGVVEEEEAEVEAMYR